MERADIAIIGTGPAGVSAAITAKVRGKTVLLFGSRELSSKLTKAHKIQNYPGLPDIDGAQLAQAFKKHLDVLEIPITEKQVTAVYAMGGYFGIQTPDAMLEASSVILAGGVVMGKPFPKEDELLGRGVSYCATCDAHFYPGKTVAVLGYNAESCREANFLAETAGRLLYFPVVPHEVAVNDHVQVINERPIAILGQTHAEGVPDGAEYLCGGWCVCIAGCCCTGQVGAGACRGGGTCKGGCQHGNQPVGLLCLRRSGGEAVPVHQGGGAGQCCSPVGCGMAGKTKEVSVCCAAHDCGFGGPTAGLRR